jgi:hypothetical protein
VSFSNPLANSLKWFGFWRGSVSPDEDGFWRGSVSPDEERVP